MLSGVTGLVLLALVASSEPRVVDVCMEGESRLAIRLENELRAAGFRVVRRPMEEAPTVGAHGEVRWSGAGAATARRFDEPTLQAVFEDPRDPGVWAIRVVEWLRADARTLSLPRTSPAPALTFEATLGPQVRISPGVGVGFGLSAGLGVWIASWLGLQVAVSGPLWTTVSRGDASALVRELAVQVRALAAVLLGERWRLLGGVGLGVRNILAAGLAPIELVRTAEQTGADVCALVGVRLVVSPRFFVELRAELGVTVPLIALEFGGTPVGLANAPGLGAVLAFGATW